MLRRIAAFFRDESCGQCVPCRVGTVRQEELLRAPRRRHARGDPRATELALLREIGQAMRDASICGLGQTASSAIESARSGPGWWRCEPSRSSSTIRPRSRSSRRHARAACPPAPAARRPSAAPVELTIDGAAVSVPAGSTILEACRAPGIDTPTLCYLENLTPVNVCRVCVVEVAGSRVARARLLAQGRAGHGHPDRHRARPASAASWSSSSSARRWTWPSPARASRTATSPAYAARYERRSRALRARRTAGRRPTSATPASPATTTPRPARTPRPSPSRSRSTTTSTSATTRAASSATSASRRAAWTPRTRSRSRSPGAASTPASRPSGTSACPTPPASTAATASASARPARSCSSPSTTCGRRARGTSRQTVTDTICPYCGVGCTLSLHVQDNSIVKVTSPLDASVTDGHLCIKGRFGFEFVQNRGGTEPPRVRAQSPRSIRSRPRRRR